jgi:hypothetical protein
VTEPVTSTLFHCEIIHEKEEVASLHHKVRGVVSYIFSVTDPRGRNAADLLTKVDGDGGLLGAEALQADYPGTVDIISA